jgi:DNA polymerase V
MLVQTELIPDDVRQGKFLDTRDRARSKALMATLDDINRRMGRGSVFHAASGVKREWATAAMMKSRCFTTDWGQLLRVPTSAISAKMRRKSVPSADAVR